MFDPVQAVLQEARLRDQARTIEAQRRTIQVQQEAIARLLEERVGLLDNRTTLAAAMAIMNMTIRCSTPSSRQPAAGPVRRPSKPSRSAPG